MKLCLALFYCFALSGCMFTRTNETRDSDLVREETWIKQEYHDGQVLELKSTGYITEVTKEVAQIKTSRQIQIPQGSIGIISMLSGGGVGAAILGLIGKKLYDRKPPQPKINTGETIKGRKEEE